jgi:holo-[acyl-carrier protein] synthase
MACVLPSCMIYGVGVDIVRIKRIQKAVEKWGDRFLHRVFSHYEIAYCHRKSNPYPSLSVRFAAKEAFIKAMGSRLSAFTDIEVVNDVHGKPAINAGGKAGVFLREHSLQQSLVSLSHEQEYAIAVVVIERERSG